MILYNLNPVSIWSVDFCLLLFDSSTKLETLFHDYDCICGLVVALFDAGRTTRPGKLIVASQMQLQWNTGDFMWVRSSQDIWMLLKHSSPPPCSLATSYIEALVVVFRSLCGSAATIDVIMTSLARHSSDQLVRSSSSRCVGRSDSGNDFRDGPVIVHSRQVFLALWDSQCNCIMLKGVEM